MILQLSVGEAVQISHIVKMRLSSRKGSAHTAVLVCSDVNDSQDKFRMVFILWLWMRGERKGTLPLVADPEHTHSHGHTQERGHVRMKNTLEGN